MNGLVVSCVLLLVIIHTLSAEKSLCEDPEIHAADRLSNGTVRVYRGNLFWHLIGIPDNNIVTVMGPFNVWYKHMLPITRDVAIQTVLGGKREDLNHLTYKFSGNNWWRWDDRTGHFNNQDLNGGWPILNIMNGFDTAYNDANMNPNFSDPIMVAFKAVKVYYYNTGTFPFQVVGDSDGYLSGGYGEEFPEGLTAAFAYPAVEKPFPYYVYLFRSKEFCFRPINGTKEEIDCKNLWRPNTQLFNCSQTITTDKTPNPGGLTGGSVRGSDKTDKKQTTSTISSQNVAIKSLNENMKVITIVFTLFTIFFNLIH